MQAWMCETLDGPASLQWRERPTPQPAPDEVLIAIHAASLNFPDLLIVQGKYQMRPELPFAPGAEFAGIVEAVGSEVKHLRPGMPVAALSLMGSSLTLSAFTLEWQFMQTCVGGTVAIAPRSTGLWQ